MTETPENPGEVAVPQLRATDPTDTADLEMLWQQGEDAWRASSGLETVRDQSLHEGLAWCARLYAAVTRGKADPPIAWWRYLGDKGIQKGRKPKLLFHPLIAHFTGAEKSKRTTVSRRAAVLQYHHDNLLDPALPEEKRTEPAEVYAWLEENGGVQGVHKTIIKPPSTEAEKQERKDERDFWSHALAGNCQHLAIMRAADDQPDFADRMKPYSGGSRLALIQYQELNQTVHIVSMASDTEVTQAWLLANAKHLVERLPPECRPGVPVEPRGAEEPNQARMDDPTPTDIRH